MNKQYRFFLSLAVAFVFMIQFNSCKKTGGEFSYRKHISAVKDLVLMQHTTVQLAATYIKAINDSTLLSDYYAKVDGAHTYLKPQDGSILLEVKYDEWGVPDPYSRYRKGMFSALLELPLNETGDDVVLNFSDFSLDNQPLIINNFIITKTNESIWEDVYSCVIKGFQMKSQDTAYVIHFEAGLEIRHQRNGHSQYYTQTDWFLTSGSSKALTAYFFNIESTIVDEFVLTGLCSHFQSGSALVNLPNMEPDSGSFHFEADTLCNDLILMDFNELPFVQKMDWYVVAPVIP
jgi:hypothetical protein